jgi:PAS domain S-box-containing protein
MSLRFKLPLFTALFVIIASLGILLFSINQTAQRRNREISRTTVLFKIERPKTDDLLAERISEIRHDTTTVIKDRIFISSLLLVVCTLAIFFFSKRITAPVNRLVALAEEITKGRKSYSERIVLSGRDEIGRLATALNTLLEHADASLRRSQENADKYRELIENANSAIIRIDGDGHVLYINEYAQTLFGYSPDETIGMPLNDTIGREIGGEGPSGSLFMHLKSRRYIEVEHRTRSGAYLWAGWTTRTIVEENRVEWLEYLCVGSDITERKKAEKYAALEQRKLLQTDKMATLGILSAGIAHEINNPNNFIILNSQNLSGLWEEMKPVLDKYAISEPDYSLSGVPYGEIKRDIPVLMQGITDGARRIKYIVDTLKDFSRQDSGDLSETVDLGKVVEAARLIVGTLIKKATNKFTIDIPEGLPAVRGNFQRLEQVAINLIANACQATDAVEKPIVISAKYLGDSKEVALTVADCGEGISPQNMKNIFNPFFTTKRDVGGTGLGLAIAYTIVKDHGGSLNIESHLGKGTAATVVLPVLQTVRS